MPGSIPELDEIGPRLEGAGLLSLQEEVRRLLGRRTAAFPGTHHIQSAEELISGAQPVSLVKRHYEVLTKKE